MKESEHKELIRGLFRVAASNQFCALCDEPKGMDSAYCDKCKEKGRALERQSRSETLP